jgi:hypothetical protein
VFRSRTILLLFLEALSFKTAGSSLPVIRLLFLVSRPSKTLVYPSIYPTSTLTRETI